MPFAKLRSELLAARDRRQHLVRRHLAAVSGGSLLQLALNIPGADKCPPGAVALFDWAELQLQHKLAPLSKILNGSDDLGPWALYASPLAAEQAKSLAVQIEEAQDFARLLDIDVYDRTGRNCDRHLLGLPERRCLICSSPAKECARLMRHTFPELKVCLDELLESFTT